MPSRPKRKQRLVKPVASDMEDFTANISLPTPDFCKVGDLLKVVTADSLGLARVTKGSISRPALELFKLRQPKEREGKMCWWEIVRWELDAAGNRATKMQTALLTVETEKEAQAIYQKQVQKMHDHHRKLLEYYKPPSAMLADEERVVKAQWEVLKEVWPGTVKAILDGANPSKVYNAETLARTGRGAFAIEPEEAAETFALLEKAYRQNLTFDPVNVELVIGWISAGYRDMKPQEYTEKINAKLGTDLSKAAMKSRAITKLGLTSRRREGRPAHDGDLPPG